MFPSLRHILIFLLSAAFMILNTAAWTLPIVCAALLRLLIPSSLITRVTRHFNNLMMRGWLFGNQAFFSIFNDIKWNIDAKTKLDPNSWYMLVSNHKSWLDTLVLGHLFGQKIPVPKFFLKKELIYVPFIGLACWGLDMPFMQRYSRAKLLKNPELRGRDLETTLRSCQKFQQIPTTVINFVEGTRATPTKLIASQSEFRHLLPPKTGGLAYACGALGKRFDKLIDVTLYYPDETPYPLLDLMCGRVKRIQAVIIERTIPEHILESAKIYSQDPVAKRAFQTWIFTLWREKDQRLHLMKLAREPQISNQKQLEKQASF